MATMIVPPDMLSRAQAIIGVPFKPKGDDLSGWDCRGCARWCLREFCGVDVPDYRGLYAAEIIERPTGRRERARLLAEGLAASWRPVDLQPGAVVLLHWLGGAGHVGFVLAPRTVIHADVRQGTALLDLDDPASGYRPVGAFVPSFITDIRPA